MAKKEPISFSMMKDEKVVFKAHVGKKIFMAYIVIFILLTILFIALFTGALFRFVNDGLKVANVNQDVVNTEEIQNKAASPVAIIIISSVFVGLVIILIFHMKSTLGREYVLTNKRILISKGGKFKRFERYLLLKDLRGVEKSSNIITSAMSIASIDFYAPSISENKMTLLKILSMSSTPLRFQWIRQDEADDIFEKLQEMLDNE